MQVTRRSFVFTALAAPVVLHAVPTLKPAGKPGVLSRLRVAKVGCGGMGESDLKQVASHPNVEIVALCDVDLRPLDKLKAEEKYAKVPQFRDWRKMYADLGDTCDAVVVSVADHMHAAIAMEGLNRGKHVYCQKPLAQQAYENRQLAKIAASKPTLVTQMGTQRMATKWRREGYQMVAEGIVGPATAMYGWTDRPAGWWPQGKPRPEGTDPVPATLDWDGFLGAGPVRPYKNGYTPFNWRGTYDWGCGAFGDMACHIVDQPFYALQLKYPTSVKCECTDATDDQFPTAQTVTMTYPATPRTGKDGLVFTWCDGGRLPDFKALGLPEDFAGTGKDGKPASPPSDGGVVLVGEKGVLYFPIDGSTPALFVNGKREPVKIDEHQSTNHWHDWLNAIVQGGKVQAPFSRAGLMCESLSLGAFSCMEPGKVLTYDADKIAFTNSEKATAWCRRPVRAGYGVENL